MAHLGHKLRHWYGMFTGTSYYHVSQGLGRAFSAHELNGYFNDLTAKTVWTGRVDSQGLPLSVLSNGTVTHFPILLCQKALGHWDQWLLHQRSEDRSQFLSLAKWLVASQLPTGGWDTWSPLGYEDRFKYSAMTQGEAVSVLVRASKLEAAPKFSQAARKAASFMTVPVQEGGVCVREHGDIFLEEYPALERDTVLNGWIFALMGLHDFLLLFPDTALQQFYSQTLDTLARKLPEFDAGYWSYYSSRRTRLASPFYHRLHISQLQAVRAIADRPEFTRTLTAWQRYEQNRAFKGLAVMRKGLQKLREPDQVAIVG